MVEPAASGLGHVSFAGGQQRYNTPEDVAGIVATLNTCPHLRQLTLHGNTFGLPASLAVAKALEQHDRIEHVQLDDMFTARKIPEIHPALSAFSRVFAASQVLTVLDFSDNALNPEGARAVSPLLSSCLSLKDLRLNNTGVGPSGGAMIGKALYAAYENGLAKKRPYALERFVLGRSRLEREGAIELAKVFTKIQSLREIHMANNGIREEGSVAIANCIGFNPHLEYLDLMDNTMTHATTELADSLARCTKLQTLILESTLLKAGGRDVVTALIDDHDDLTACNLSYNEMPPSVGRLCFQMLQLPVLDELELNGNVFGEEISGQLGSAFAGILGDMEDDENPAEYSDPEYADDGGYDYPDEEDFEHEEGEWETDEAGETDDGEADPHAITEPGKVSFGGLGGKPGQDFSAIFGATTKVCSPGSPADPGAGAEDGKGLFGAKTTTSTLFGSGGGLAAFGKPGAGSIFGTAKPPCDSGAGNIFGAATPGASVFGKGGVGSGDAPPVPKPLDDSAARPTGSLFGGRAKRAAVETSGPEADSAPASAFGSTFAGFGGTATNGKDASPAKPLFSGPAALGGAFAAPAAKASPTKPLFAGGSPGTTAPFAGFGGAAANGKDTSPAKPLFGGSAPLGGGFAASAAGATEPWAPLGGSSGNGAATKSPAKLTGGTGLSGFGGFGGFGAAKTAGATAGVSPSTLTPTPTTPAKPAGFATNPGSAPTSLFTPGQAVRAISQSPTSKKKDAAKSELKSVSGDAGALIKALKEACTHLEGLNVMDKTKQRKTFETVDAVFEVAMSGAVRPQFLDLLWAQLLLLKAEEPVKTTLEMVEKLWVALDYIVLQSYFGEEARGVLVSLADNFRRRIALSAFLQKSPYTGASPALFDKISKVVARAKA